MYTVIYFNSISAVYLRNKIFFFSVVASEHLTATTIIPENLKHILEPVYPYSKKSNNLESNIT
jgi:hypothetical protein